MLLKGELYRSGNLQVVPNKKNCIQMNPNDGAELNFLVFNVNLDLYNSENSFVEGSKDFKSIELQLPNEIPYGKVFLPQEIYAQLMKPSRICVFTKKNRAYIKSI